jgi:hydrogenase nickel incorporation protein HypA/HybF
VHELGIAMEIHRACRAAGDERGAGRLERVTVAVGELSAVEPDLLGFAWEALMENSPDAGAELEIEWRPCRQICAACGEVEERGPGTWMRLCPRCDGPLRIEGGDELDILQCAFAAPATGEADDPAARSA